MTNAVWTPVTKQSKPYFTEEDTKKIYIRSNLEKKIDSLQDESQLVKIAEHLDYAASWYFEFKNRANGPKTAQIKKSLERVQKTASAFYKCLSDLDHRTKYEHLLLPVEVLEKTEQNAGLINYKATKVLEDLKIITHRPPSVARKIFICMLADIYEETTGNEVGVSRHRTTRELCGPFFWFVKNCLEHIDALDAGDEALRKSIQHARRDLDEYKKKRANLEIIRLSSPPKSP